MYISVNAIINLTEKKCKINTDHVSMLVPEDNTVFLSNGLEISMSEANYAELEKALFPTRKIVANDKKDMAALLTKLHNLTGGKGPALLSPKREKALKDIMNIPDMTEEKLVLAATNLGKDKWMQGENDNHKRYGTIDYLLRVDKAVQWAEHNTESKRRAMF